MAGMLSQTKSDTYNLLQKYFPERAIPGIMGNIDVETGGSFNYQQKQTGGPGYGLFQFDFQKPYYFSWLKKEGLADSAENQIRFVSENISGNWKTAPMNIDSTDRAFLQDAFKYGTDEDIAETFMSEYENPQYPHTERRIKSAEKYRGMLTPSKL